MHPFPTHARHGRRDIRASGYEEQPLIPKHDGEETVLVSKTHSDLATFRQEWSLICFLFSSLELRTDSFLEGVFHTIGTRNVDSTQVF